MSDDRGPVETISAVTLGVTDMTRSVAFYSALGFRVRYGGPDATFTSFELHDGYLNLGVRDEPVDPGWGRIVLYVGDVDAVYARVIEVGLEPAAAPRDAPWGERFFHIRDPDGHELSFARPLTPAAEE